MCCYAAVNHDLCCLVFFHCCHLLCFLFRLVIIFLLLQCCYMLLPSYICLKQCGLSVMGSLLPSLLTMLVLREVRVVSCELVVGYLVCSHWNTSWGRSCRVVHTTVLWRRAVHCRWRCLLRCRRTLCSCSHRALVVHICSTCWPLVFLSPCLFLCLCLL